jgi:hypothetical protein
MSLRTLRASPSQPVPRPGRGNVQDAFRVTKIQTSAVLVSKSVAVAFWRKRDTSCSAALDNVSMFRGDGFGIWH